MLETLSNNIGRFALGIFCFCLVLKCSGCGTSSYSASVEQAKKELDRRSKFSELDPEYRRIFVTPFVLKFPKYFVADEERNKKWIAYGPKFLTSQSRNPYLVKTQGDDARGAIEKGYAEPVEFDFPPFSNGALIGTLACEFNYDIMLENGKQLGKLPLTMTIWGFDASPQKMGPPPPKEDAAVAQIKTKGKFNDPALKTIRENYLKAGKAARWEDETIIALPTAEDPQPKDIAAKMIRIPIRSSFLNVVDDNRRMVEKNGHLYLWTFRIETYQFYLALRAPDELFAGETPLYAQDLENSDSDPFVSLGRAVIGSFKIEPSFVKEFEELRKKGPPGKKAA